MSDDTKFIVCVVAAPASFVAILVFAVLDMWPLAIAATVVGAFSWWAFEGPLFDTVRQERVARAALTLGLSYVGGGPRPEHLGFSFFETHDRGTPRNNTMVGRWHGLDVALFDYDWVEWSGGGDRRVFNACGVATLPVSLPRLSIDPKGLFGRRRSGTDDIVDTGWDEFDRRFEVRSKGPAFARALLDPALRQWLLSTKKWSLSFEVSESGVLCVSTLQPEAVLEQLEGFVGRIPRELMREGG